MDLQQATGDEFAACCSSDRPRRKAPRWRTAAAAVVAGGVLFAATCLIGSMWFGGVGAFTAFAHGQDVYIGPTSVDLGKCDPGATVEARFVATNLTSQDASISGMRSDCSCTFLRGLPVAIPAGKTVRVSVSVRLPRGPGAYSHQVIFFASCDGRLETIPAEISAAVSGDRAR